MSGDRIIGWVWAAAALTLASSGVWYDWGGFMPTLAAVGGGFGFLSGALRHWRIADDR
mgnify:CR=1 FL=1